MPLTSVPDLENNPENKPNSYRLGFKFQVFYIILARRFFFLLWQSVEKMKCMSMVININIPDIQYILNNASPVIGLIAPLLPPPRLP